MKGGRTVSPLVRAPLREAVVLVCGEHASSDIYARVSLQNQRLRLDIDAVQLASRVGCSRVESLHASSLRERESHGLSLVTRLTGGRAAAPVVVMLELDYLTGESNRARSVGSNEHRHTFAIFLTFAGRYLNVLATSSSNNYRESY